MIEQVRDMLQSKVRHAPALDEPPTQVLRRARGRRVLNAAGLAAGVAVIAVGSLIGVRSLGTSEIEPVGPVPWVERTVDVTPPTRPCRADELTLTAQSTPQLSLIFHPKDETARCMIVPFEVQLRAQGTPVAVVDTTSFAGAAIGFPYQTIVFGEWVPCAPRGSVSMTVVFPHGAGTLVASATRAPFTEVCASDRAPSKLNLVAAGTAFDEASWAPGLDRVRAVISAPPAVARGSTLQYKVTLTNPQNEAVRFDICPAFAQTLELREEQSGVAGEIEAPLTYLNCETIGNELGPRRSATFLMRFAIPEEFPAGRWTLRWLVTFPTTGPDDSVPITITAN